MTALFRLLGIVRPLYSVLGAMTSPPTATWKGDGTTTIVGAVTYNQVSGVWRYLNATATHASGYYQTTPNTGQGFIADTETAADEVDLRFLRFNSSIMVFVNRQPIASSSFTTDAAGSANLLQLRFAGTPLSFPPNKCPAFCKRNSLPSASRCRMLRERKCSRVILVEHPPSGCR